MHFMSQDMLFALEIAKNHLFLLKHTILHITVHRSSICPVCCQVHDLVTSVHVNSLATTGVQSSSSTVLTENLHIRFQNFTN